ncbi:MAG: hypothetical protein C0403_10580 [Desulfobacterium sp.]|nr:hypothetical protein [Desulfobacterium sp.]
MYNLLNIKRILAIVYFIFASLFVISRAQAGSVWIVIENPQPIPSTDGTFETELKFSSWDADMGAYSIILHYDPTVLQIIQVSVPSQSVFNGKTFADEGSFLSGSTQITAFQVQNRSDQSALETFATIQWKVLGESGTSSNIAVEIKSMIDVSSKSVEAMSFNRMIYIENDSVNKDSDEDGIPDEDDAFANDPNESLDNDGDGTGDNADIDDDNDGIRDNVENAHPNGGDGNNDNILDSLQNNVTSLRSYRGLSYVTIESPMGTSLSNCQATDNPSPDDSPAEIDFSYGFFNFTISGIGPGDSTTLKLYFPADAVLETYYKYGRTPNNQTDHWYEFLYDDGETGAEIDSINKIISLHFVDAKRGDDILTQDSMVVDLGGPGTSSTANTPSAATSGGDNGGCYIGSLTQ